MSGQRTVHSGAASSSQLPSAKHVRVASDPPGIVMKYPELHVYVATLPTAWSSLYTTTPPSIASDSHDTCDDSHQLEDKKSRGPGKAMRQTRTSQPAARHSQAPVPGPHGAVYAQPGPTAPASAHAASELVEPHGPSV